MASFLNLRNTVLFVGLLTLWRLYLSATLQLHPDEAYYWLWSRQLELSYFDHSPLVAYFIRLTTLVSQSEFWVRLSGNLVILAASYLTWQLAMRMFGNTQIAAGSVMLFNSTPLAMFGLIVITPDIPVYLFWALSLYLFWLAVTHRQAWRWHALGIAFGMALLSKYTAILLMPSLLFYLLLSNDRKQLFTLQPWLAMLLGFACFVPVILWNSQHQWISFLFQFHHGVGNPGRDWGRMWEFFASQMLLVGPLVWLAGMYAGLVALFAHDKARKMLAATSLFTILLFGFISIAKLAGPNWSAFAYFGFIILVTRLLLDNHSRLKRMTWYAALLSTLLLSALLTLQARFSILPLAKFAPQAAATDATNGFYGWRELGAALHQANVAQPVIVPSHQLGAEIIYYTHGELSVRVDDSSRPSQFHIWQQTATPPVSQGSFVWSEDDDSREYLKFFPSTACCETLPILRDSFPIHTYYFVNQPAAQKQADPGLHGDAGVAARSSGKRKSG